MFGESIPSHADWHIHMEHAYNFKKCLLQGQLLPRWTDGQANGYGLPIFNFYAPSVYYVYTIVDLITKSPVFAIKFIFALPIIMCTLLGYLYLRRHGSPLAATLAMSFVIFSPAIHIFIYNTNWPGSTLALAFLFLALYGMETFDKEKDFDYKTLIIISFSYAAMAFTHLATAFVFTLISIPYFFLNLSIYRTKKYLKNFFFSMTLGGCLSAVYLFPAAFEKRFVHTDEVLTEGPLWDFTKNFLFTYLDRNKDEGYAWAIFDHRYYELSNALFSIAIFICLIVIAVNFDKLKNYFSEVKRIKNALFMFVLTFLMMTPLSILVWYMMKPLQTIQFPWRFTAFMLPFGAVLMVYSFDLVKKLAAEKINVSGYKIIFSLLFVVFSCLAYVDFINMFNWRWMPEQSLMKAGMYVLWGNEEYWPSLTNNPDWKSVNYRQDFSPTIGSSNVEAYFKINKWLSHDRVFEVFSKTDHQLRLRTFYFPGWKIFVDGKSVPIKMDQRTGAMVVDMPGGGHEVRALFGKTPVRQFSEYVSFVALLVFIAMFLKLKESRPKLKSETSENKTEDKEVTKV